MVKDDRMNTLLDRLRGLFTNQPDNLSDAETQRDISAVESAPLETEVALDDGSLSRLMLLIEQTKEGEYACEETLDLLDEYAELAASDQDAEAIMPLVKGHLEHCVDCSERYEALLRILEGSEA